MDKDYVALLPEMILMGGAIIALIGGSFVARHRQWAVTWFAIAAAVASATSAALQVALASGPSTIFAGTYSLDSSTVVIRILVPLSTVVVLLIDRAESRNSARESETAALLLLAGLGTIILASADDLLIVATGFLLATVPLYALIGLSRTPKAAEATMKTYLLGAIFGVTMLLGVAVLISISGGSLYTELRAALPEAPRAAVALGFVGVLAGLLFKAGAAPAHFWVPDASEGSRTGIAAFVTTVPKLGALVAMARLVEVIPPSVNAPLLVAILAAVSMTLGTLAAFWQSNIRRLLGWSTVGQVGFLLMAIAAIGGSSDARPALLTYLVFYAITNLALFAALGSLPNRDTLTRWQGVGRTHPWIAGVVMVGLLSLVGTPPTVVFAGKVSIFVATWDAGFSWLVVLAAVISVASLFYALRWISPVVGSPPEAAEPSSVAIVSAGTAVVLGLVVVGGALAAPLLLGL